MAEVLTTVRDLRTESPSAATIRLDLGGEPFPYRPGQYITIDPHQFEDLAAEIREREAQRGKPLGPGYFSLSSDGLDPSLLEFTVKLPLDGPPGMLPKYLLAGLDAGRKVRLAGPGGKYGLPETPPEDVAGFVHLCAGSGVAPNRGMIRHALSRNWPQRHLLLVQDREEGEALFRKELADLAERHPDRFRIRRLYSRPGRERIDADRIRAEASGWIDLNTAWAFVCGPNQTRPDGPGFVDHLRLALGVGLGFPPERIRTE
jgi:ring-1,2-phenylacetyl-CoA epoxidase subunit PaaE